MDDLRREFLSRAVSDLENLQSELQIENYSENFHQGVFRLFHTLKGSSQTFNLNIQGKTAHEIENLLQAVSERQIAPNEIYIELLTTGVAILLDDFRRALTCEDVTFPTAYVEKIRAFLPHPIDASSDDLSGFVSDTYLKQLSSTEKKSLASAVAAGKNFYLVEAGFSFAVFAEKFKILQESLRERGEIVAAFPSPKFAAENKIGFQIFFVGADGKTEIEKTIEPLGAALISQNQTQEFSGDLNGVIAQAVAGGEQLAEKIGKKIKFEVVTQNIELPLETLRILSESLLHLVRNAADHAIETQGAIKIEIRQNERQDLILKVSDNGRGIDLEKVRRRAVAKNLIAENDRLPDAEILNFIFAHGFSTSDTVSEISGRGVGLDIVKDSIEKAGGTIQVESTTGKGTTFEICLPKNSEDRSQNFEDSRQETGGGAKNLFSLLLPFALSLLPLLFTFAVGAQDLPGEIRGYKVHRAKINVQNTASGQTPKETDATVSLGDPVPIEVSTAGVIFEIGGEIAPLKKGGQVDFLSFQDFRINGLRVGIEEYKNSFELSKDRPIKLPQPLRISVGFGQAMFGALQEWRDSREFWQVTGRVFVFGRFKKFGFKFKRVIPVDVNLQIKNPLKSNK